PLVEVMTDKASVEIPAPRTGTIASLHAKEGDVVPVGSVIVSIALAGEVTADAPAASPAAAAAAEDLSRWGGEGGATTTKPAPANGEQAARVTGGRVHATPAVRQLAKKLGVALET